MLDKFMKNAKLIIITVIRYDKKYFHLMKENSYLQIQTFEKVNVFLKKFAVFCHQIKKFEKFPRKAQNFLKKVKSVRSICMIWFPGTSTSR